MKQAQGFLTVLAITFFMSSVLFAQDPAVIVTEEGKVGIGTTSPEATLDVRGDIALPTSNRVVFGVETEGIGEWIQNSLSNTSQFGLAFYTNSQERMRIGAVAGNVGIGTAVPTHPLEMGSGAHVTAGGVWTDASSRAYKENIQHLTLDAALMALETLEPVQYNYKVDPEDNHLGFIAEDVPDLVASKNRKGMSPMDVVAVLTKVVQQQQQQIAELKARLDAQQ